MKMKIKLYSLLFLFLLASTPLFAQDDSIVSETNYNALELRNIGPALTSGRIADIAIHPQNESTWYVAVGSGGVWKTVNDGTTMEPIFDNQSSYSIGSVTIDPNNPNTVWVGTGENVGGRHVGYGDGVYKSTDAGKTWENMGLENSEHISKVVVHPENSDVIWVSAQGPLWSSGGERGLYKSTDGGENWTKVLGANEWTGVTDHVLDPRNPDVMYAATWQRHRTKAAYQGGGPGSGIHKSTDGGETWTKLTTGLPNSNYGKIGLAVSPQNPDIVYAAITLDRTTGGVYMSDDRGASWKKMSDAVAGGTGPHYYQELYASPHEFGKIYLMNNYMLISDNHGKDFYNINNENKHVDDHAIAFKKSDPDYLIVGSDGGLYETHDGTESWRFINNMPITQFYKISVDNAKPFYHVYGGTQDNGSQGGPSRTDKEHGIANRDWYKTLGADGHDSATEPGNPDIFYGESQRGGLHRIDRVTGDQVFIQPQAPEGGEGERFNWDAPIEVSPHSPTRLYFASNKVWKTEDRGNSWTAISGDLTRDQNRLELDIMGRQMSWDNPWDMKAMTNYNTISSLAESPLQEGLIYAGTDDGRIQVTENGGESWRAVELGDIRGVPATVFVNDIYADLHDANTVYAALDNHKDGDFEPYIVKSTDRGRSWELISEDLPDRHIVWRVVQDDVKEDLLFAATEFGIFFTVDGGEEWVELKGGAPTIAFRDLVIQRDRDDLVGGSFGRGIFILDDYTPLREVTPQMLNQEAKLFDSRDAYWYVPKEVVDSPGHQMYTADNPPFGAVFTYYLKEELTTLKQERQKRERAIPEEEDVPFPGWDNIEKEMRQQQPKVEVVIKDQDGNVVNRVEGPHTAGFHRIDWDLRYPSKDIVELGEQGGGGWFSGGFPAVPGTYTATLTKTVDGVVSQLSEPISFDVVPLYDSSIEGAATNEEFIAFRETMETFRQEMTAASDLLQEQIDRVTAMQTALDRAEQEAPELVKRLHDTRMELLDLNEQMNGSEAKAEVGAFGPPTPRERMFVGYRALSTTYGPTENHRNAVEAGRNELDAIETELNRIVNNVMPSLQQALEAAGAPPVEE